MVAPLADVRHRLKGPVLIVGFRDKRTAAFYRGRRIAAFSGVDRAASRKLDQLDAATSLTDLARPGNRLEALKGRRKGQWSIRINDQWRICFKWFEGSQAQPKWKSWTTISEERPKVLIVAGHSTFRSSTSCGGRNRRTVLRSPCCRPWGRGKTCARRGELSFDIAGNSAGKRRPWSLGSQSASRFIDSTS